MEENNKNQLNRLPEKIVSASFLQILFIIEGCLFGIFIITLRIGFSGIFLIPGFIVSIISLIIIIYFFIVKKQTTNRKIAIFLSLLSLFFIIINIYNYKNKISRDNEEKAYVTASNELHNEIDAKNKFYDNYIKTPHLITGITTEKEVNVTYLYVILENKEKVKFGYVGADSENDNDLETRITKANLIGKLATLEYLRVGDRYNDSYFKVIVDGKPIKSFISNDIKDIW